MIATNRRLILIVLLTILVTLIAASCIGPLIGITSLLDLDQPGSIAVWFEAFLYLWSASLLALIALASKQKGAKTFWRWGVFSLLMLYLSINTTTEINKKIVSILTTRLWWLGSSFFDLLLFLSLAGALLFVLWPVLAGMPPRIRRALLLSGMIFGLGAIVVDDLGDLLFRGSHGWFYVLEELLEFSGQILFLNAIMAYIASEFGALTVKFHTAQLPKEES